MKICPNCNAQVEDHMTFCPNCGAPQEMNAAAPQEMNADASQGMYVGAPSQDASQPVGFEQPGMQPGMPPVMPGTVQNYYYPQQMGEEPVSVGDWLITYLLMIVPFVNLIMLIVWAVSSETKKSKQNWARASLIWMAIGIVIYILIIVLFGAAIYSAFN